MNFEFKHGLRVALQSFDTIAYGSHVHVAYRHVCLYSTCLLIQLRLAQLGHRTIRLSYVRHGEKGKPAREEQLPELPDKMRDSEAYLTKLEKDFRDLMDVVCQDPEKMKE